MQISCQQILESKKNIWYPLRELIIKRGMIICFRLYAKKEKNIEELEEKCLSFENRVLSLEQENDSLRLALQIIVQEKNECDSRPQKADDSWSLVENTHPAKSMKNKRSQQTITSDNIGTRNRFEPLGNEVQDSFIDVNPTPINEASEDKRNKVPSARHSQTSNF